MKKFIGGELPRALENDAVLGEVLDTLVPDIIYTPRDARRFAAAFAARQAVLEEVEKGDLLGYCALECRIPVISERLQNPATLVSVDGSRELRRRADEMISPEECVNRISRRFQGRRGAQKAIAASAASAGRRRR